MNYKEEKGSTKDSGRFGIRKNVSPSANEGYQCIPHGSLSYKMGRSNMDIITRVYQHK
jgi:hypothetical protein